MKKQNLLIITLITCLATQEMSAANFLTTLWEKIKEHKAPLAITSIGALGSTIAARYRRNPRLAGYIAGGTAAVLACHYGWKWWCQKQEEQKKKADEEEQERNALYKKLEQNPVLKTEQQQRSQDEEKLFEVVKDHYGDLIEKTNQPYLEPINDIISHQFIWHSSRGEQDYYENLWKRQDEELGISTPEEKSIFDKDRDFFQYPIGSLYRFTKPIKKRELLSVLYTILSKKIIMSGDQEAIELMDDFLLDDASFGEMDGQLNQLHYRSTNKSLANCLLNRVLKQPYNAAEGIDLSVFMDRLIRHDKSLSRYMPKEPEEAQ